MNAESVFGVFYIAIGLAGIIGLLLMGEGIFNLLYRFVPAFRCWYDKLDSDLPDWDMEE